MILTVEEDSLPAYENLREEVTSLLHFRFGVPTDMLEKLYFVERQKGEIWVTTAPTPSKIQSSRPAGVRAFRRMPRGLKPTTVFLCLLGDHVKKSRLELDDDCTLKQLLLGKAISYKLDKGYIAISYLGDVLGCGEARQAKVRALIPTIKRRELLECLEQEYRLGQF